MYEKAFKTEVLGYIEKNRSLAKAKKKFGISQTTYYKWLHEVDKKKVDFKNFGYQINDIAAVEKASVVSRLQSRGNQIDFDMDNSFDAIPRRIYVIDEENIAFERFKENIELEENDKVIVYTNREIPNDDDRIEFRKAADIIMPNSLDYKIFFELGALARGYKGLGVEYNIVSNDKHFVPVAIHLNNIGEQAYMINIANVSPEILSVSKVRCIKNPMLKNIEKKVEKETGQLNVKCDKIEISPIIGDIIKEVKKEFSQKPWKSITKGSIKSRISGLLVKKFGAEKGKILYNENKSIFYICEENMLKERLKTEAKKNSNK